MYTTFRTGLSFIAQLTVSLTVGATAFAQSGPEISEGDRWSETTLEFSLSGKKADDGADGRSYRDTTANDGYFSGADGANGADGSDGENVVRAENAKPGRLLLESSAAGIITFSGSFVGHNESMKAVLKDKGFFRAVSRGGNGAMPGFGGWGQDGGDGARGSNGVGRQSGGNGGDGGRGGDPGRGFNGGDAGDGKEIRIGVPADQLELAWVVEGYSRGGLGGERSDHGRAGDGGSGGAGGTGGTYTTTHTSTDSKGKTATSTRFHKSPDGSRGSSGSDGTTITTPLRDGDDGKDGQVIWEVLDSQGNVLSETNNRFQVQVVGFDIVDNNNGTNPDGVFEPGEKGRITNIRIVNTGDIPTPRGVKTRMRIKKGAYFYTDDVSFSVPEGLGPQEGALVKGVDGSTLNIPIQVKDFNLNTPSNEPFIRTERIVPVGAADVAGVKRNIPEFNQAEGGIRDFTVQFPVLIEPITTLTNLSRGEASKYIFKITNISGRDFGSDSEVKKHLEFMIKRRGGDVPADGIEFFDNNGKPIDINTGFLKALKNLKAGASTIVETIVGVSPIAESYRSAVTNVDLNIDRNGHNNGEDLSTVQRRVLRLSIADDYYKTPDSDFLLVTNNKLSRQGYEAWKGLVEGKLKSSVDIWDITYKNFITFVEKISEHGGKASQTDGYADIRSSLGEDFRGKTIVLMANEFTVTDSGDSQKTIWDYINIRDLRAACALYDINLYVVGEKNSNRVHDVYKSRRLEGSIVEYSSMPEMLEDMTKPENLVSVDSNRDAQYWETGLKGQLTSWRFFTQPSENLIQRKADKLLAEALKINPDADFTIVHRFDASREAPLGFSFSLFGKQIRPFGSTWNVGNMEVWRSIAPEMGNVVVQSAQDWDAIGSLFVNSQQNLANLMMSRSFEVNLKAFEHSVSQYDRLTSDQKDALPVLMKTLEKMLVLEQVSLRYRLSFMPGSSDELAGRLKYLKAFSETNLSFTKNTPPEVVEMTSDVLLNVLEYAKGQRKWWEKFLLLGLTKNAKIARQSQRMLEPAFVRLYERIMDKGSLKKHLKRMIRQKREALKSMRSSSESWSRLTLRAIEIDELIEKIPNYRRVIKGVDFDFEQARLDSSDVVIDRSSDDMIQLRSDLKVNNPILDRFSMGQKNKCSMFLSK